MSLAVLAAAIAAATTPPPATADLISPRYYTLPTPAGSPALPAARLARFGARPLTANLTAGGYHLPRVTRTIGLPFHIDGTYVTVPGGAPLPAIGVQVADPLGRIVATTSTDTNGNFTLTAPAGTPGLYTFALIAQPQVGGQVSVATRRAVSISATPRVRFGQRLVVAGAISPAEAGKLVALEWRDRRTWRPLRTTRTRPDGSYGFSYRIRRQRGFTVKLRVVAPAELGSPFLTGQSTTAITKVT